jgi:hypothetical protein
MRGNRSLSAMNGKAAPVDFGNVDGMTEHVLPSHSIAVARARTEPIGSLSSSQAVDG